MILELGERTETRTGRVKAGGVILCWAKRVDWYKKHKEWIRRYR